MVIWGQAVLVCIARDGLYATVWDDMEGLCSMLAEHGGELTSLNPTDYGKLGAKYQLVVSTDSLLLAAVIAWHQALPDPKTVRQAARTVAMKVPTSVFSRSASFARLLAVLSTWPAAEPVSVAVWVTPMMFVDTCSLPRAA